MIFYHRIRFVRSEQGGFEFDGCEQKNLSRLVRFADPRLHGYVPIIRGKVLRMAKQGLCIYVR